MGLGSCWPHYWRIVYPGQKWHNSIVYGNIYQSITVSKMCRDLLLFGYLSLGNLSFSWYSSFMNSGSIKNFPANLITIFSKNSNLWSSSTMKNSSSPNSSTQKVVNPYIFPKQWQIDIFFGKQWYLAILAASLVFCTLLCFILLGAI